MHLILLALCLLGARPARAADSGLLSTLDSLYQKRSAPAAVKALEVGSEDDALAWREARILQWQAYELPWPKRDWGKSAALYEKVIAKHPQRLRAYLFLAETHLRDGKADKARDAIQKVKQGSVAFDPAEGRRVQELAKKVEADIEEELK